MGSLNVNSTESILKADKYKGNTVEMDIFIALGAHKGFKDIHYMKDYLAVFKNIMKQQGIANYSKKPDKREIARMVQAIQGATVLSIDQICNKFCKPEQPSEKYHGIAINPNNDSIRTQGIYWGGDGKSLNLYDSTYKFDNKGNVEYYTKASKMLISEKDGEFSLFEIILDEMSGKDNSDGIGLEKETKSYSREQGEENVLKSHKKFVRDEEYPFVAKKQVFVQNGRKIKEPPIIYTVIDSDNFKVVNDTATISNDEGKPQDHSFKTKEEVAEYYKANKKSICKKLSGNKGMKKLARSAGIITEEVNNMGISMLFKKALNKLTQRKKTKKLTDGSQNSRDRRAEMHKKLQFSEQNLLSPEFCRGKNLVSNIFMALGVNKRLLEGHPVLKGRLEVIFEKIMMQHGLESYSINPSEEEIEAMVRAIKKSAVQPKEHIQEKLNVDKENNYYGIEIEPRTGRIKIQAMTYDGLLIEEQYDINKSGKFQCLEDRYIGGKRSQMCLKEYNDQGIEIKRNTAIFEQDKNGKGKLLEHVRIERNHIYDFIADVKTIVSGGISIENPKMIHKLLKLDDLPRLDSYMQMEGIDGKLRDVEFPGAHEIKDYYRKDKKRIDAMRTAYGMCSEEEYETK